jgi:hypothetical protein
MINGENHRKLYNIFIKECKKHNIMYNSKEIFEYLNEYPEKEEQMSFF